MAGWITKPTISHCYSAITYTEGFGAWLGMNRRWGSVSWRVPRDSRDGLVKMGIFDTKVSQDATWFTTGPTNNYQLQTMNPNPDHGLSLLPIPPVLLSYSNSPTNKFKVHELATQTSGHCDHQCQRELVWTLNPIPYMNIGIAQEIGRTLTSILGSILRLYWGATLFHQHNRAQFILLSLTGDKRVNTQ